VANETALLAVQAAVFNTLNGDTALSALAGVHDHVPEGETYPYVVVGEGVETPDNTHDNFGSRVAATLHIWSHYRGYAEALQILGHLMRLLDHQDLEVLGRGFVACRHDQTVTMRDPDPDVRHVVVRFAFDTYQTL
jgi:hypothetical protein